MGILHGNHRKKKKNGNETIHARSIFVPWKKGGRQGHIGTNHWQVNTVLQPMNGGGKGALDIKKASNSWQKGLRERFKGVW